MVSLARVVVVASSLLTAGCAGSENGETATTAPAPPCEVVDGGLELGAHALDAANPPQVTLSGERYRLSATGFLHDGPFDPDVGRTTVAWGRGDTAPQYDAGPATVGGAGGQAEVVEDEPMVVVLEGGTWWFLNSNGVELTLEPCSPATGDIVDRADIRR